MLPKIIASIPARKNLIPAKRIWDMLSLAPISKSSYPIFMLGNALPHSKQHTIAKRHTTTLFSVGSYYPHDPGSPH